MHLRLPLRRLAVAACAVAALAVPLSSLAAASRRPAYCTIPTVTVSPWGFHTGLPITGATGSYAHGHGNFELSSRMASGIMCQVDRVRHAPDRQIIVSIGHRFAYYSHTAVMWGFPGNLVKLDVRVIRSTDPACPVGTAGEVTIFASYNGVHQDSIEFSFPNACRSHQHLYHSSSVVTNVMPS